MLAQSLVVALVVALCSVYAAWKLMPAAARRGIASASLRLPLPRGLASFMQRHAVQASGCGCDGCDQGTANKPAAKSGAVQPIVFQPRLKRDAQRRA